MDYNENNVRHLEIHVESEENSACSPPASKAAYACLTSILIIIHLAVPAIGIVAGNFIFIQDKL